MLLWCCLVGFLRFYFSFLCWFVRGVGALCYLFALLWRAGFGFGFFCFFESVWCIMLVCLLI